MVRLLINAKLYPKRFPSADAARNWFHKRSRSGEEFDGEVAALVNESGVKYYK